MRTRVFLDRSRKVRLEGRPLYVDWSELLYVGMAATDSAQCGPFLSSTMWINIYPLGRFLRPVLFDFPLLRRWLEVEPSKAMDYMRDGFGFLEAPRDVDEALAMLARDDCYAAGLGSHRLAAERRIFRTEASRWGAGGQWVVGTCNDCLRATLWFFPDEGDPREWPFYDQTVEVCERVNQE